MRDLNDLDFEYIGAYYRKHGKDAKLQKIEDAILSKGNAYEIYMYAYEIDIDIKTFENAIIATKNPTFITRFARDIKHADRKKLEAAIIEIGDPKGICYYAEQIKTANIKLLQEKIIKIGNPKYIIAFMLIAMENTNTKQTQDAIIMSEDAIIKSGDAKAIFEFAQRIPGANIDLLQEAIIKTNNHHFIYKFGVWIDGSNKKRLFAVAKTIEDRHSAENHVDELLDEE